MFMRFKIHSAVWLTGLLIAGCSSAPEIAEVGAIAPAFQLAQISPSEPTLNSESLKGKPVVLNFWSTSCSVCLSEIEDLNRLQEDHGVRVIGIALDEDIDRVRELAAKKGIKYDVVMGSPELFEQFNGYAIPHTVILTADQTVQRMVVGRIEVDEILKLTGQPNSPVAGELVSQK